MILNYIWIAFFLIAFIVGLVQINFNGETYDLPVIEGSEEEKAIDIAQLRGESGLITMDPGFKNTGSTKK